MSYAGISASGIFTFNEAGEVLCFTAKRFYESKGRYSLEDWLILVKDYKEFGGYKIPSRGEGIWQLQDGDFNWYKFEIQEFHYN